MADKETKLEKLRKKPGMSNAGKYKLSKTTAGGKQNFAGPSGTYPINTLKRARSALRLAHFSNNSERIKKNVYKRWPALKPEIGVQSKSPLTFNDRPPVKALNFKKPKQYVVIGGEEVLLKGHDIGYGPEVLRDKSKIKK